MNKVKVVVSWSSGKDSALTLLKLLNDENYEVVGLFTTYYTDYVPFQGTPLPILMAQAQKINLPLITQSLPKIFPDNPTYQQRVIEALKKAPIAFDAVAFGDMFYNGIVEYRQSYIEPAGWQCVFPLLGISPQKLASEIIEQQIKAFVCTVDSSQCNTRYLGQEYTHQFVQSLPENVDPCGENGEFHTLVYDAPFFNAKLGIIKTQQENDGRFFFQRYRLES
ncbi:hypothetical protein [Aliikangiella maris]|uniref:Uncharacterized protein n=2 Tax=Aliikangiella maris TaxID=3162458 RepID=A0ABV2BTP2_9GAMM